MATAAVLAYLHPDAEAPKPGDGLALHRRRADLWAGEIELEIAGRPVVAVFAPDHPQIEAAYEKAGVAPLIERETDEEIAARKAADEKNRQEEEASLAEAKRRDDEEAAKKQADEEAAKKTADEAKTGKSVKAPKGKG